MAKKILVVEDDRFLSSAYRVKLQKEGFEVEMAGDGNEALLKLEKFVPDLVILDLVMPNRDGFSTLEEMGKKPGLAKIPVIVTSNLGQKEDIERAKSLGACDYVIKSDMALSDLIKKIKGMVV